MIIYKITNLVTNKIYIGQTVSTLHHRFNQHVWNAYNCKKDSKGVLKNSIKKYGKENFSIEQIDSANSLDELNLKEELWIKELNSMIPSGYNIKSGGDSSPESEQAIEKRKRIARYKKPSDGYKCVVKKRDGKFRCKFSSGFYGDYNTKEEAAWIHDEIIRKEYDGDGYLNFPNGMTSELKFILNKSAMDRINKTFGVSECDYNRWKVIVPVGKTSKYLCYKGSKIEAMCAYDAYIIEHGIDAPLNFNYRACNTHIYK
jgi:group I intron endonuclease